MEISELGLILIVLIVFGFGFGVGKSCFTGFDVDKSADKVEFLMNNWDVVPGWKQISHGVIDENSSLKDVLELYDLCTFVSRNSLELVLWDVCVFND